MEWQESRQQDSERRNKGKRKTTSAHVGPGSRTSTRSTARTKLNPQNEDYVFTRMRCSAYVFKGGRSMENVAGGDFIGILGPDTWGYWRFHYPDSSIWVSYKFNSQPLFLCWRFSISEEVLCLRDAPRALAAMTPKNVTVARELKSLQTHMCNSCSTLRRLTHEMKSHSGVSRMLRILTKIRVVVSVKTRMLHPNGGPTSHPKRSSYESRHYWQHQTA